MAKERRLTSRAQFVLSNLDRVVKKPYVLEVQDPRRRSQLDGVECTQQITSLVVRGIVQEDAEGKLTPGDYVAIS